MSLSVVVAGKEELIDKWELLKTCNWSDNTWKCYRSRWNKFEEFCKNYDYISTPASVECVCVYITYLCQSLSYSSIDKYVSAIWALHDYNGVQSVNRDSFLIRATLAGARRLLGDQTTQVDPLLPRHIIAVKQLLKMSVWQDFVFWVALVLSYRCLLRVSHVTKGPHMLRVGDIVRAPHGIDVCIKSAKNLQFRERITVFL